MRIIRTGLTLFFLLVFISNSFSAGKRDFTQIESGTLDSWSEEVDLTGKKTGKYKRFPLNAKLKALIKDYLINDRCKSYALSENEPLFLGKKHCRLDRSQVYRFLNEACKQLGITANVGTHTMRKSFGYHFYKKYNDVALLQKILNHSSPAITLRYIGIAQEEIDFSYNNFEL